MASAVARLNQKCHAHKCRHISTINDIPAELLEMMHGRRNKERRDSVTREILLDRYNHQERLKTIETNKKLFQYLESHGLGVKRRRNNVYQKISETNPLTAIRSTITGAGGSGMHISSATSEWPIFDHLLPEIAFAGHSNSGKSTLVNAMVGVTPRKGPASISERAGWTDQICFYKLGKRPPVMTLVDFPGYGHAVASAEERKAWTIMTRGYLQEREIVSLCCVLVDCTRGLCEQDNTFLRMLAKVGVPRLIVLTKSDLLDADDLASSISVVAADLDKIPSASASSSSASAVDRAISRLQGPLSIPGFEDIVPVSASTGAGVQGLWRMLRGVADRTAVPAPVPDSDSKDAPDTVSGSGSGSAPASASAHVREHLRAVELRRRFSEKTFYAAAQTRPRSQMLSRVSHPVDRSIFEN